MTEEEKKAIEDIKRLKIGIEVINKISPEKDEVDIIAINTILNLIEKQSKEIEELKKETLYWKAQLLCRENNVISKQKIRDKIEELNKCRTDPLCEENIFWRVRELQELLEGEITND